MLEGSNASFVDVRIASCAAEYSGGALAIRSPGTHPSFAQLLLSGCAAGNRGGAIDLWGSSASFSQATITGNSTAGKGGALYVSGRQTHVSFSRCIVVGNAGQLGGGIYAQDAGTLIDCQNCAVFLNPGGDFAGFARPLPAGQGNIAADPLFCDAAAGVFTLDQDSPCAAANHPSGLDIGLFPAACRCRRSRSRARRAAWQASPSRAC